MSSSCEEFSEPKRMTRGTHTKTLQPGSPRNFAHVSKFSLHAPDDNEFTDEGCFSLHDERVDECRREHTKDERSSGFVPRGVRRRQPVSSSREWKWLEKIERDHRIGAECVAPESIATSVSLMETEASRQGQTYHTADQMEVSSRTRDKRL